MKTKVTQALLRETLFTDDYTPVLHTWKDLKILPHRSSEVAMLLGLQISQEMTEFQFQLVSTSAVSSPFLILGGIQVNNVSDFKSWGNSIANVLQFYLYV